MLSDEPNVKRTDLACDTQASFSHRLGVPPTRSGGIGAMPRGGTERAASPTKVQLLSLAAERDEDSTASTRRLRAVRCALGARSRTVPTRCYGRAMESSGNPNDAIRQQILRYFFERNAQATSRFGKKGSAVKISDVKRELKAQAGLTQQQVMSNLTYLLDRQWVKAIEQRKEVSTRAGTTVPSVVTFYEISAQGIERIEGESEFQAPERFAGINIQASGSNVITLGDGNIVNVEYRQLFQDLTELRQQIADSDQLSDRDKLDAVVDIDTLKDQLAKRDPDRDVVGRLWPRIAKAADLAGLGQVAASAAPAIGQLLG